MGLVISLGLHIGSIPRESEHVQAAWFCFVLVTCLLLHVLTLSGLWNALHNSEQMNGQHACQFSRWMLMTNLLWESKKIEHDHLANFYKCSPIHWNNSKVRPETTRLRFCRVFEFFCYWWTFDFTLRNFMQDVSEDGTQTERWICILKLWFLQFIKSQSVSRKNNGVKQSTSLI